ncbi:copper amine oxidase N-terminal domain-containing protein [Desulfotomaculum nigrificans]|uniref:copper amine oxidase N-terminal domain-containing protein n=1 Tax=Desulfotomaculum nigrificans TaxID=1565 RepID=UPI0001FAE601|nr:copper amine oxidase N-terminal domain-containing protein [Desulfotomaculum nigrificans]
MIKKMLASFMAGLGVSLIIISTPAYATDLFHNTDKILPPAPLIINEDSIDSILVPSKVLTDTLGLKFDYQPATKTVVLSKDNKKLMFYIDRNYYTQDGKNILLRSLVLPKISSGLIYLPLKPVSDYFGVVAEYDKDGDKITLKDGYWDLKNIVEWEQNLGKNSFGELVNIDDGILVPYGNKLAKINKDGYVAWTLVLGKEGDTPEEDQFVGTPLYAPDHNIYVATSDFKEGNKFTRILYKISKDGNIEWKTTYSTDFEGHKKPFDVTADKKYVYVTQKNMLMAYDHEGIKRWQYNPEGNMETNLIAINNRIATHRNDTIFLDTNPLALIKLDFKGNVIWKNYITTAGDLKCFVYDDSRGYGLIGQQLGEMKTMITLYDIMGQQRDWDRIVDGDLIAKPLIQDNTIYLPLTGRLLAVDLRGNKAWEIPISGLNTINLGSTGILAGTKDGRILIINSNGEIVFDRNIKSGVNQIEQIESNKLVVITEQKKLLGVSLK